MALPFRAMADKRDQEQLDRDEPVAIPLDPVEALRALLKVDPESEPPATDRDGARGYRRPKPA
jgi:hypothetical protein